MEDFIEKKTFNQRPMRDKPCVCLGEENPRQLKQAQRHELRVCLRCLRNSKVSVA